MLTPVTEMHKQQAILQDFQQGKCHCSPAEYLQLMADSCARTQSLQPGSCSACEQLCSVSQEYYHHLRVQEERKAEKRLRGESLPTML